MGAALLCVAATVFAATPVAEVAKPRAMDHLEEHLAWIEKHTEDLVAGRKELAAGLRKLKSDREVPPSDVHQACEVAGDQTKLLELIRGQLAELAKPENQEAMNAAQRKRFSKVQAVAARIEPKVGCSAY
jgi:valyl-tRNA synthetase